MKMDEIVQQYIKLREKKAQLKAEYEAKVAPYEEVQEKIEALLLAHFAEFGVESVKTSAGTAYASIRSSASMADWDTFKAFCEQQDDPFAFLDRRVNKSAVEQFKEAHGDIPPGVNWSETRVVNFRRT